MRPSKFTQYFKWHKLLLSPVVKAGVVICAIILGILLGFWTKSEYEYLQASDPQTALIYTENQELAQGLESLTFYDWKLKIVVIDEPTEWEIKTLAGHGAHLILVNHRRMEKLDQMGLLERAKVRVPLFSFLATDFRKTSWTQVFLPLFWKSENQELSATNIWGLSVPRNTPNRKLSWKAFYDIVRHPHFKAKLAGTPFGLTLEEFEKSPIEAQRKPSWLRNH